MDGSVVTTGALAVVSAAGGFYVFYLVVRAAVRDGIVQAREDKPEEGTGPA
ncbi:hypothetical protein [Cryobacterium roopkundense]|uniref:Uncharacterized protein n=1 Tax=Cryobacterium roopkundense TaxID=1001240 RepID=A0A7W8ZTA2_9MICO|nr:hypothetical protein [Cryobacterium roopkundense]MBB5639796.1 hypothetical protein [Cryobacterium roopkundense]